MRSSRRSTAGAEADGLLLFSASLSIPTRVAVQHDSTVNRLGSGEVPQVLIRSLALTRASRVRQLPVYGQCLDGILDRLNSFHISRSTFSEGQLRRPQYQLPDRLP